MTHVLGTARIALVMAAGFALAAPAAAQEVRPVLFGAAGFANIFRTEDQSFGTELNLAGGGGIEWKRLGIDAEVHRTLGLTPREVSCAVVSVPCTGSAHEGVSAATMISANVSYLFGGPRVRPYVAGSVGVLRTEIANSLTIAGASAATISEVTERDSGLAIGVGAGVDVAITPRLSLRPEFRTYSSVILSRANLGMHRGSIAVRYRW
jgi:opacity protein-like surface antigen